MCRLIGFGRYLPARVLTNADITATAHVSDAWIVQRTGIRERRVAEDGEGTARMSERAAALALADAHVAVTDIDLVLVATSTPDHLTPPTACQVQAALGVGTHAACFDVEAGFAGWIYALVTAHALIETGIVRNALVIGAEKLSTVTDRTDAATAPLFGDGAGAVVLTGPAGPGLALAASSWWADGRLADALSRPAGGAARPFDSSVLEERAHLLRMEGTRLFRQAVRVMAGQARSALDRAGLGVSALDLVVPHQANRRIIDALTGELELAPERVFVNIERYGNTGAATIPIALAEARESGVLDAAERILLVAFGAGATAGAVVLSRQAA